MSTDNSQCINFLDKKNPKLKEQPRTFNSHIHKLHESGVGTTAKHAEIISKEESRLWDKGVMGANSPSSQLNTVFSGNFGEGHRNLKLSQLEWWYNPDHYIILLYTENCSKNLPCGHFWPAPRSEWGCAVIEILVWQKKWSGGPKFQEKWSIWTIFSWTIGSELGIMVQVWVRCLIAIATCVFMKNNGSVVYVVNSNRECRYVTRKEKQSPKVAGFPWNKQEVCFNWSTHACT